MSAHEPPVLGVIQARMSSRRFPGKVLARFRNRPVLDHVVDVVREVVGDTAVIVATSTEPADDGLAAHARGLAVSVVRGPLDDVLARFQQVARESTSPWLLRVTADSPLLDREVLRRVVAAATSEWDLVTTTFPRSFPVGTNAEAISRAALLSVDPLLPTRDEREHVTRFFYNRTEQFRIRNVWSGDAALASHSLAVDSPADLARLEALSDSDLDRLRTYPG
jgi:spore coat polysaccharide biosynthesis protein SpsF